MKRPQRRATRRCERPEEVAARRRATLDAVAAVRAGNVQAFAEIIELYGGSIRALCATLTPNRADADDLAQEAFVRAFRHLDRFDPERAFYPWLATIAYRLAHSWYRRDQRREDHREAVVEQQRAGRAPSEPADEAMRDEQSERLWQAVRQLAPTQQCAVQLYYRDGLPVQATADVMGVTDGTVKTLLYRARQRLGELLREPSHAATFGDES